MIKEILLLIFMIGIQGNNAQQPLGIDVDVYQPNINWNAVKSNGIQFVYIMATDGTTTKNPNFGNQYNGATNVGLIRGSYHLARPNESSGTAQAIYFIKNGGGWSADGRTLPGVLDIEGGLLELCYGLSPTALVAWISDFSNTYHSRTGRYPVIYTTTTWWIQCTGNSGRFAGTNPLWIARWGSAIGQLPAWPFATFWQYAEIGPNPGGQDRFLGDSNGLNRFARGS